MQNALVVNELRFRLRESHADLTSQDHRLPQPERCEEIKQELADSLFFDTEAVLLPIDSNDLTYQQSASYASVRLAAE